MKNKSMRMFLLLVVLTPIVIAASFSFYFWGNYSFANSSASIGVTNSVNDIGNDTDTLKNQIASLKDELEKVKSGWLTIVGLILTFSGFLLVLVNFSFYFSAKDMFDKQLKQSEYVMKKIEEANSSMVQTELISEVFKMLQNRMEVVYLRQQILDPEVLHKMFSTFYISIAFSFTKNINRRRLLIDSLIKNDLKLVANIKKYLQNDSELSKKFNQDISYIDDKIDEIRKAI